MNDIHALSGAYAIDALDDLERARFEQHLAACTECRAEVSSFRATTALLAWTEAESPPASLRSSVLTGIRQVRPLPPETTMPTPRGAEPGVHRRRLPQLLAAAAAVVLLAVGALAWQPWQHDTTTLAIQVLQLDLLGQDREQHRLAAGQTTQGLAFAAQPLLARRDTDREWCDRREEIRPLVNREIAPADHRSGGRHHHRDPSHPPQEGAAAHVRSDVLGQGRCDALQLG